MTAKSDQVTDTPRRLGRRPFLGLLGAAGAAAVGGSALAGCSSAGAGGTGGGSAAGGAVDVNTLIPAYQPIELIKPDFPSVDGSTPGYLKFPADLATSVAKAPGRGGTFKAMVPLWGTIPPPLATNTYLQDVNKAINAKIEFQITDGNAYGEKLQAVLASPQNVPDYVTIPSWEVPPRFTQAAKALFADLTPFLAGDKISKYPNLANIASPAWKCCVFDGTLYGLPYSSDVINDVLFYRVDLFEKMGLNPELRNGEDLLKVAKEITDSSKRRWACNDIIDGVNVIYAVPKIWKLDDGKLVHRFESEEYRESLALQAKLFKAGVVHPDAVAGNETKDRQRFVSGQVLIDADGIGGWQGALEMVAPDNRDFKMHPLPPMSGQGGDPVIFKGTPSNLFTFIKKTDDQDRIEEMLALADYCAAPFGTKERTLVDFGVEGEHYKLDAENSPIPTEKGRSEVATSYSWIARGPLAAAAPQYPNYVKEFCTWMSGAMKYAEEPLFYTQQIVEPNQYAALKAPFEDLEKDIGRGRKSMADLDTAIEHWRKSGGDKLREFYQGFLEDDQ